MSPPSAPIHVAALYRFTTFADCAALRGPLERVCAASGVKGTLLLAGEGINGTIAGPEAGIARVLDHIRGLPGCAELDVKFSLTDTLPFHRLKVRIKAEIVTLGVPGLDPVRDAGTYVRAQDWNALIAEPGTIVIDTRNAYEVAVGTFAGAVNPGTISFRDFPAWFRDHGAALVADVQRTHGAAPKVAMFCTGGIRCEKATAYLKAQGVDQVHHLEGGVLRYLETTPAADSLWRGECFVFDQRVAVGHGLAPGTHVLCHGCRMPVSPADQESPLFEPGVSCPRCHQTRDDERRGRYAERQRQMRIAAERGVAHIGVRMDREDRDP
ncbi:MAG: Rhodanese domain protein [Caulobacter sp.]|nr:Rhodanese domain protein [Caulobacter sp.]